MGVLAWRIGERTVVDGLHARMHTVGTPGVQRSAAYGPKSEGGADGGADGRCGVRVRSTGVDGVEWG